MTAPPDKKFAQSRVQAVVDGWSTRHDSIRALDAGCGARCHVSLSGNVYRVGLDASGDALDANPQLDERIVGDLEQIDLQAGDFDIIICWFVLEHLRQPNRVLAVFVNGLRDDGLLVLAVPVVFSVKGLVAKFTPHWFHIWYYRRLLGRPQAGTGHHAPFKTYLRFSLSEWAIRRFARRHRLTVLESVGYEDGNHFAVRSRFRMLEALLFLLSLLARMFSDKAHAAYITDKLLVLSKTPAVRLP